MDFKTLLKKSNKDLLSISNTKDLFSVIGINALLIVVMGLILAMLVIQEKDFIFMVLGKKPNSAAFRTYPTAMPGEYAGGAMGGANPDFIGGVGSGTIGNNIGAIRVNFDLYKKNQERILGGGKINLEKIEIPNPFLPKEDKSQSMPN